MNNNNILSGKNEGMNNESASERRRRAILNLFLADNPAFEVCLRNLQDRGLPDNDRIVLKAYADESVAEQIDRFCLNLQSVLFTLSVFPEVKIPEEVLDGFFEMAGELIYVLHHLAEGVGDDASKAVPGLRCAPPGLRGEEVDLALAGRQRVPALALLRMLRGGSL
ncbi:MAG TPA: hypothetical protein ENJ08_18265 [Gammaproteobacteria bacterium]|nr:hypothetical protein [Gammaproteobacteria bacterium]